MPKVKKKNIGGNPLALAKLVKETAELGKKAKNLYDSINTLKEEKEDLYNALMDKVKNGDIKGIEKVLETELENIDSNSSEKLKHKIEEIKNIYDSFQVDQLEQIKPIIKKISGSTNSIQVPGNLEGNLEGFLNQGANQGANPIQASKENKGLETQGNRVDQQFDDRKKAGMRNLMQGALGSEHGPTVPALSDNRFNYRNNSGINLGYSEPPEDTSNSRTMYIMIAIAMKGILRYIWNFFVVTVKTSYRVLTDFILIPFYIFLPYVFDVLAVFIILIMLILVILYFVSGGGSKQTRPPGNPFDSIISGVSSIISSFFNPDLSGVTDLKDNFESDATSFVGGIEKFIKDIIDIIKETIIAPILRNFIPNPDINDIDEKDKEKREKDNGRCDNISEIESKDGRYCYKQLKQKDTTWGDNITIPYKLFEEKDMDNPTADTNYDYYMPNCKIDNNFTDAVIDLDTEDNRRTKFICKI